MRAEVTAGRGKEKAAGRSDSWREGRRRRGKRPLEVTAGGRRGGG